MEISKQQVLNYRFPRECFNLIYTNHAMQRLRERCLSLDVMPTVVKITPDNIVAGRVDKGRLASIIIKLPYAHNKDLYLCIGPKDRVLKSLWFKPKFNERRTRDRANHIHSE